MAAAALLKNQKIAILQGFELTTVNVKRPNHLATEPQSVLFVHFKLCSILYSENLLLNLSGKFRCNSPVGCNK